MKNNKSAYILTIIIFFFSACSEDIMDEIDFNDNILVEAPIQSILPQVSARYINQILLGSDTRQAAYISEITARVLGRNEYEDVGTGRAGWFPSFLLLRDLEQLKTMALEQEAWLYAGIADLLKVFTLNYMVDMFGDVPYSEAVKLEIEAPRFDDAETLYDEMFIVLDEALSNMERSGAAISPGNDDMFFGGDADLWRKTAYGLKARLSNRLSNIDPQGSAQNALSSIQNSFANENEAMIWENYIDASGNRNPRTAQHETAVGLGIWNTMLHFSSDENIEDDPRHIWFTILPDGERRPAPNGEADADFGTGLQGNLYSKLEHQKFRDAPAPVITYNELLFIKAESHFRLENKQEAYEAYLDAVRLSLEQSMNYDPNVSLTDDEINTYLSLPLVSPGAEDLTMEDIILQKVILFFNFQWIEAWNEVRKEGVIPANNPRGRIHRLPYPDAELLRNPNAPQDINLPSVFLDVNKLFWAK